MKLCSEKLFFYKAFRERQELKEVQNPRTGSAVCYAQNRLCFNECKALSLFSSKMLLESHLFCGTWHFTRATHRSVPAPYQRCPLQLQLVLLHCKLFRRENLFIQHSSPIVLSAVHLHRCKNNMPEQEKA